MPAFALAFASAIRVASLNLCTDEYVLALAAPGQIASLSYLSGEPGDSRAWREARRIHRNNGTLESALPGRPTHVLTMGGAGKATSGIAARLGLRVIAIGYPQTVAEVRDQALRIGAILGQSPRAQFYAAAIGRLQANRPAPVDAMFVGGGGNSLSQGSLGAEWLALAGYRQRALPSGRVRLETLATAPPKWLIRSDYREREYSRGQSWFDHPVVRRLARRTIRTDGRAWTCAGLPMVGEVERLRKAPH